MYTCIHCQWNLLRLLIVIERPYVSPFALLFPYRLLLYNGMVNINLRYPSIPPCMSVIISIYDKPEQTPLYHKVTFEHSFAYTYLLCKYVFVTMRLKIRDVFELTITLFYILYLVVHYKNPLFFLRATKLGRPSHSILIGL